MFCPICRGEYIEGLTHCNKCAVDLIASLPAEEENNMKQFTISFSKIKEFIFDIESMLKIGGWALIIVGVLYHASDASVRLFQIHLIEPSNKIGTYFEIIKIAQQFISSIMWGLFYIALGHIIRLLKDRNVQ